MRAAPLVLLCVAGACAEPPPQAVARSGIIGGVRDSGDPAVVLLVSYPPGGSSFFTCTASVIAPAVLLTAAHCIDAANHPGHVYGAFLGDDASAYASPADFGGALRAVSAVHPHPAYDPAPPFTADIGVVLLADPLAITPLPIARAPLSPSLPGSAARLVGYGQTSYGTYNATKWAATTTVAALPPGDTVVVGDALRRTCVGDSGSPALVTLAGAETIVGVDSYAETTGCTEPAHYRRVDHYLDFLEPYAPAPPDLGAGPAPVDDLGGAPPVDGASQVDAATAPGEVAEPTASCALAPGRGAVPAWLAVVSVLAWLRRRRAAQPPRVG